MFLQLHGCLALISCASIENLVPKTYPKLHPVVMMKIAPPLSISLLVLEIQGNLEERRETPVIGFLPVQPGEILRSPVEESLSVAFCNKTKVEDKVHYVSLQTSFPSLGLGKLE